MSRIVSFGHAVPDLRVTSADLEVRLGLEAGWIERRTGIRERRYAGPGEATSDLAVRAGADALSNAGRLGSPVGLLLLATSTPDHPLPPTAPLVAHRLGLVGCGAIDLANACGGFIAALALGDSYCNAHGCSVLIVAANVLSKRINPADPMTAALFADGAGAVLLSPGGHEVLSIHLDSHGEHYASLSIPAGGGREPFDCDTFESGRHWMKMDHGPELFRLAVRAMVRAADAALKKAGLEANEIDWWVPHQANARMTAEVGMRLNIPTARTVSIIEQYGNTSAASIPMALALSAKFLQNDERVLLTAAGAGMVEAAAVIRCS